MKKAVFLSALVLVLATAGLAQNLPRFELSLYGGYGLKDVALTSSYGYSWTGNYYYLDQLGSYSDFAASSKGGMDFGAGMTFYVHPNFGVGLSFNYFKTSVTSVTDSDMWWSWTYSGTYYYSDYYDAMSFIGMDNSFQSMQISLNFVGRFGTERFQGYLSAGPSLFMNKLFLESEIAYAAYWVLYAVDVFQIPTDMNQSWSSFGANFGAGFTFWLAPQVGIFFDARYYLSGSKTFDWTFYADEYEGLFGNFYYDFDEYDVEAIFENGEITPLEIKPGFLALAGGIKIRLM